MHCKEHKPIILDSSIHITWHIQRRSALVNPAPLVNPSQPRTAIIKSYSWYTVPSHLAQCGSQTNAHAAHRCTKRNSGQCTNLTNNSPRCGHVHWQRVKSNDVDHDDVVYSTEKMDATRAQTSCQSPVTCEIHLTTAFTSLSQAWPVLWWRPPTLSPLILTYQISCVLVLTKTVSTKLITTQPDRNETKFNDVK